MTGCSDDFRTLQVLAIKWWVSVQLFKCEDKGFCFGFFLLDMMFIYCNCKYTHWEGIIASTLTQMFLYCGPFSCSAITLNEIGKNVVAVATM